MMLAEDLKVPAYIMYNSHMRRRWEDGPLRVLIRINRAFNAEQKNKDVGKYVAYFEDYEFLMGNGESFFGAFSWERNPKPILPFELSDTSRPREVIVAAFEGIKATKL